MSGKQRKQIFRNNEKFIRRTENGSLLFTEHSEGTTRTSPSGAWELSAPHSPRHLPLRPPSILSLAFSGTLIAPTSGPVRVGTDVRLRFDSSATNIGTGNSR